MHIEPRPSEGRDNHRNQLLTEETTRRKVTGALYNHGSALTIEEIIERVDDEASAIERTVETLNRHGTIYEAKDGYWLTRPEQHNPLRKLGSENPNARVSEGVVARARWAHENIPGVTVQGIADAIGVDRSTVNQWITRETWDHVEDL